MQGLICIFIVLMTFSPLIVPTYRWLKKSLTAIYLFIFPEFHDSVQVEQADLKTPIVILGLSYPVNHEIPYKEINGHLVRAVTLAKDGKIKESVASLRECARLRKQWACLRHDNPEYLGFTYELYKKLDAEEIFRQICYKNTFDEWLEKNYKRDFDRLAPTEIVSNIPTSNEVPKMAERYVKSANMKSSNNLYFIDSFSGIDRSFFVSTGEIVAGDAEKLNTVHDLWAKLSPFITNKNDFWPKVRLEKLKLFLDLCYATGFDFFTIQSPEEYNFSYADYITNKQFENIFRKICGDQNFNDWIDSNNRLRLYKLNNGINSDVSFHAAVGDMEVVGVFLTESDKTDILTNAEEIKDAKEFVEMALLFSNQEEWMTLEECFDVCKSMDWEFPKRDTPEDFGVSYERYKEISEKSSIFHKICNAVAFDKWLETNRRKNLDIALTSQLELVIAMLESLDKSDNDLNEEVNKFVAKVKNRIS